MFNNYGGGCGIDPCMLLILLSCCGGCGTSRKGCGTDCCDIIMLLILISCLCGGKESCCK